MNTAPHPSNCATLTLPEILDLKAASKLTTDLIALRKHELVIDASQVRRLGGQCLQVLLSARATWDFDGVPLHLADASSCFIEGLQHLGIAPEDFVEQEHAL
jgi:chemotaxis protein CheX